MFNPLPALLHQIRTGLRDTSGGLLRRDAFARSPISGIVNSPEKPSAPAPVSLLLYLAGLCVTLSALYAVNYGLEDPRFALLSYGLAIGGYGFSYVTRLRKIDMQSVQWPLVTCVALLILASVSGSGAGWFMPANAADNRALELQLLFAWGAIIHAWLLNSDSSVLFACVPAMTMLALVSTLNPDDEIQHAFLVFIGAATFLMVHENYLRTRSAVSSLLGNPRSRRLFGGQAQLAAACLACALILANLVAVPIQSLGQTLFEASGFGPLNNAVTKTRQALASVEVSEENVLDLAVGPTPESDTILMRVQCERGLYWRGTTFNEYTGVSFRNAQEEAKPVGGAKRDGKPPIEQMSHFQPAPTGGAPGEEQTYQIPQNRYDLSPEDMRDSRKTTQRVTIVGGTFNSLYGAAAIRSVTTTLPELKYHAEGALIANVPVGTAYQVESQVPSGSEDVLRAASSDIKDVPDTIAATFLQIPHPESPESQRLRQLTEEITRGQSANYDKAEAIKTYIATHCKYNLQSPRAPRDRDIVAWFLFDEKEGYCDSFAAAMTVLCRYAGVPARMASGFLSGDLEPDGTNTYLVRQKHKHVWAEVFFPRVGWVPFDATDGAVDISDHSDTAKQKRAGFIAWLLSHGALPPLLAAIMLGTLGYVVKTELVGRFPARRQGSAPLGARPATNQQIAEAYAQMCARLARRGLPRPAHLTPDEYAAWVAQQAQHTLPGLNTPLNQITALYTRFRYGREIAEVEDVSAAQESAAAIQNLLQTVKQKDLTPNPSPGRAAR